jgi:pimeloyl-ACP methyl ester carboxylesterase
VNVEAGFRPEARLVCTAARRRRSASRRPNHVGEANRLPVLDLLSSDSVATLPHWAESHENQLRNVRHHEVVVLEGGHYLHWTQSEAVAARITAFLDENLQR